MLCIQALNCNPSNSHLSPVVLRIKPLIFTLNQLNYNIHFLWIPSHTAMHGNEVTDNPAKSTSNLIFFFFTQLPQSDFILFIKRYVSNFWSSHWKNLPSDFTLRYRHITLKTLKKTLFNNLCLHIPHIAQFNRLHIGHN